MRRLSLALMIAAALVACGGGKKNEGPRKLRFAIIPKALDIPVFTYARIGAESEAKARDTVDVIWRAPDTADPLKQKEVLESFITQRVDGIAISCTNSEILTPAINRAMEAGIPVITWDSDAPESKRIAYYGVDDFKAGQTLGAEAAKRIGNRGTVAYMTSLGAYNLQRRLDGVKDALSKHRGIKAVETYDVKEDILKAAEILAQLSNRHPNLDALISVGGWPIMTKNMLEKVNTQRTKVFTFDTIPPAPDVLRAGKVELLIGQKYFHWGIESVKMLANIKAGQMPAKVINDSGVDIVTRQNVDEYQRTWNKLVTGL